MGTWQLYVDETGDFGRDTGPLAVGGWLTQGYATPQLEQTLRACLASSFVGLPYPIHAAHHNVATSLLVGPLRAGALDETAFGESAALVRPAFELAHRATSEPMVELRTAAAGVRSVLDVDLAVLARANQWLRDHAHGAWSSLALARDHQRTAFSRTITGNLAALARRQTSALAWTSSRTPGDTSGDDTYWSLFEALVERVAFFVAAHDEQARLWITRAKRPAEKKWDAARDAIAAIDRAKAHPLLARRRSRGPEQGLVIHEHAVSYREAPAGVVVADFVLNQAMHLIRRPFTSWPHLDGLIRFKMGMGAALTCPLVSSTEALPAFAGNEARGAIKAACEGGTAPELDGTPDTPPWVVAQSASWVRAIREVSR